MTSYIIFGGTFDPIHRGHLAIAAQVQALLQADKFFFLPCKIPLLKHGAEATPAQRIAMLRLAIDEMNAPQMKLDTREMTRTSPSYMITTLRDYREAYGASACLTLMIGMDAFIQFTQWREWENIIHLTNLLIIDRPTYKAKSLPKDLTLLLQSHETNNPQRLIQQPHGLIYHLHAAYDIASSTIRDKIQKIQDTSQFLSPQVSNYIKKHDIYRSTP